MRLQLAFIAKDSMLKCLFVINRYFVLEIFSESRGGSRGGAIAPPKTYQSNFFTIILYNSESNIRDIWPFRRPLFCYRSVVKYTSPLLQ